MIVTDAKDAARQWVQERASTRPGFCGAFFHGSINWLPDDAVLPPTCDLDVMVVLDDPDPPHKPGKFVFRDVLLEATYLPANRLETPEQVLADYPLAGSFKGPSIILDPSGRLTRLQAAVSREYARRHWVRRRCEGARDKVLRVLQRLRAFAPFHEQVAHWLFAAGIMTHVLLVAGLKNPTVRRRYVAARELLAAYGQRDFYEILLEPLGCAHLERARVERHLAPLAKAFDAAQAVIKTPFPFAADISDAGRPIAIDGSRALIARGDHREAIFWMVASYSRCQQVLAHDAPAELLVKHSTGYRRLLGDLGVASYADLERRRAEIKALLPWVWDVAEAIMAANPEIKE